MRASTVRLARSAVVRRTEVAVSRKLFPSSVAVGPIASLQSLGTCSKGFHSSSLGAGKVISFNLPDIGEGIAEVEVLAWHVSEGQKISQFDKLLEVQSDKATVDITSRYDGIVKKLLYKVGEMAPTGKPLLEIELQGESAAEEAAATEAPAAKNAAAGGAGSSSSSSSSASSSSSSSAMRALATPAVRRIAREHNIDITTVSGTGKDGRVTKDDMIAVVEGKPAQQAKQQPPAAAPPAAAKTTSAPGAGAGAAAPSATVSTHVPRPLFAAGAAPQDTKVPVKGLARAMVKSMNAAWSVPHFGYSDEVSMDSLVVARQALKGLAESKGLKFSFLPFIVKATSLALSEYPSLNAHVNADASEVTHKGSHNIGVAMDTPRGLIVPNIKAVQERSLLDIASELGRLQSLASAGKLGEADLSEGTFTLSNIGAIGGTYASPVLFMPQVAIGALGKIQRVPKFAGPKSDVVVPSSIMTVSWAADHRVVDGATMARFSNAWKGYLENPLQMLAHLR